MRGSLTQIVFLNEKLDVYTHTSQLGVQILISICVVAILSFNSLSTNWGAPQIKEAS